MKFLNNVVIFFLIAGLLSLSSEGRADTFGLSVTSIKYDVGSDDTETNTLVASYAWEYNDIFDTELRLGFGLTPGKIYQNINFEIDSLVGFYAKAKLPTDGGFRPYAILGISRIDAWDDADSDISYGIGFDLMGSDSFSINLEYINYYDQDVELRGVGLGYRAHF